MAGLFRAEGIVIACRDFGEADKLLQILTPTHGKVEAIAKGARKVTSSLRGATQLLALANFQLYDGRNLATVTQCELKGSYLPLRASLATLAYAYYLAEIAAVAAMPGEASEPLYSLCLGGLRALADGDPELAMRSFEARVMRLSGWQPRLRVCASCGQALPAAARVAFAASAGGALCPECGEQARAISLSGQALAAWQQLAVLPWAKLSRLRLGPGVRAELSAAIPAFLEHVLEHRFRAKDFITTVRSERYGY